MGAPAPCPAELRACCLTGPLGPLLLMGIGVALSFVRLNTRHGMKPPGTAPRTVRCRR
ncbi:hypothetical protein EDD92_2476 [Streptomyces sp. TLI_185]|nr:hypothetical protein EDD92_2476 [Streptomyces sp. TLI_185]